jgi:alkanesulfonate monooxygenase SsuD/methylene tetrahydromethanopterin reductase-like flavin-dependent oxidoreductase (luciferase family)
MVLFGVEPIAEDSQRTIAIARLVETCGYDYLWNPDSQLIWRELVSLMTVCALNTSRVKLGTGVTNLTSRDPTVVASSINTVNEMSNGRAVLGLGRGDSALRLIADEPMSVDEFKEKTKLVKALCSGEKYEYKGRTISIGWNRGKVPLYIAAYGPKMLEFAGQIADGVILQIGEPNVVKWAIKCIKKGAEGVGRDPGLIDIVSFTACYVSEDQDKARKMVRWYPATVSNHVFSLMSKYGLTDLPSELVMDMESIRGKYDYWEHDVVGARHSNYVSDRLVDSFTIAGNPEWCIRKVRELEKAGITNVNLYLPTGESEYIVKTFAERVIPSFR